MKATYLSLCISASMLVATSMRAGSTDWPQWRGPNRDGLSADSHLSSDWNRQPPRLLWTATGIGNGYASVSVVGDRIYTTGDRGDDQLALALDRQGSGVVWEQRIGPAGGIGHAGSRCTPTVDGDRIYVTGTKGDLVCLGTATGNVVWRKHFVKDFLGRMMSGWGFSESPLVDGDKLVCTPGGKDASLVALNKMTGELIWKATVPVEGENGRDGAGYSSIVVSNACGKRQYVQLMGRGVVGVDAESGDFLWSYNRIANRTANVPTPIVSGDYVFCSSGYGTGAALLRIERDGDEWNAAEEYFLRGGTMQNHHGGMVLVGDHVYCGSGHNNGFPICVELKTGTVAWFKGRGPGKKSAAVGYADGNLYFRYQNGVVALIEATPKEYREKGTFTIPDVKKPSWPHPVIIGGCLYLREQDRLLCYDVREDS